jgi:ankyrin repeat protein
MLNLLTEERHFPITDKGWTPLHYAGVRTQPEVIKIFLEIYSEEKILYKDASGQNFLHLYAENGGFQDCLNPRLFIPSDILTKLMSDKDNEGKTPEDLNRDYSPEFDTDED